MAVIAQQKHLLYHCTGEIPMSKVSLQQKMNMRVLASPISDSIRQLQTKLYADESDKQKLTGFRNSGLSVIKNVGIFAANCIIPVSHYSLIFLLFLLLSL
jgi:hypothetical protein